VLPTQPRSHGLRSDPVNWQPVGRALETLYFPGAVLVVHSQLVVAERSGLARVLQGYVTIPFWLVSLLVGIAVTAGLVYLLRRSGED